MRKNLNNMKYRLLLFLLIAPLGISPAAQLPFPKYGETETGIRTFASNRIPPCTHSASGSGKSKGEAYGEAMGKAPSGLWTLSKVSYQQLGTDKWLCTITWENR